MTLRGASAENRLGGEISIDFQCPRRFVENERFCAVASILFGTPQALVIREVKV